MLRDKKTGYQRNLNYEQLVSREMAEEANAPVSAHSQRKATNFVLSPFYSRLFDLEHQENQAPVAPVRLEIPHQYLEAMRNPIYFKAFGPCADPKIWCQSCITEFSPMLGGAVFWFVRRKSLADISWCRFCCENHG